MGKDLKGKELGPGLTQRKDGRYEAKYKDRDGKRKSIYGFKLTEVKRKLADAKYEAAHGMYSSDPKLTVNKWFETWIKVYKKDSVKESTLEGYLYTFKHISREIGDMNLKDVKTLHLQTIINNLNESGYAYSTLTLTRVTMHAMFEQAVIDEYVSKNPSRGVKLPTDMTDEKRILTREEEQEFLKNAKGTVNEYAFRLALMTGMRSGEISGLRWSDINWEKKELYIRQAVRFSRKKEGYIVTSPKSKTSIRTIPLRDEGIELLKLRRQQQLLDKIKSIEWNEKECFDDLVFTTKHGRPIGYSGFNNSIKAIIRSINKERIAISKLEGTNPISIEPFSMHSLRHTFATRAFESGIKPKIVQEILGHSTLSVTTDIYMHTTPEHLHEEIKKFDVVKVS